MHAGFGGAFGDDVHDHGKRYKSLDDLLRVLGRNEKVEIVHGLLATAEAAADLGVGDLRMLAQRLQNLLHQGMHLILAEFGRVLLTEGDAIEKTDWVVKSITESGIMLRSKDGTGVDFLKFARGPSLLFDFNKK